MQLQRTSGFRCDDVSVITQPQNCPRPIDLLVQVFKNGLIYLTTGLLQTKRSIRELVNDISSVIYLPGSNLFLSIGVSYQSPSLIIQTNNGSILLLDITVCSFGVNLIGWVNCSAIHDKEAHSSPLYFQLTQRIPLLVLSKEHGHVTTLTPYNTIPFGTLQIRGTKFLVGTNLGSVLVFSSNATLLGSLLYSSSSSSSSTSSSSSSSTVTYDVDENDVDVKDDDDNKMRIRIGVTSIAVSDVILAVAYTNGQIKIFSIDEDFKRRLHYVTLIARRDVSNRNDDEDCNKQTCESSYHPISTLAISPSPSSSSSLNCFLWGANDNDLFLFQINNSLVKSKSNGKSNGKELMFMSSSIPILEPTRHFVGMISNLTSHMIDEDTLSYTSTSTVVNYSSSPTLVTTRNSYLIVAVPGAMAIFNVTRNGDHVYTVHFQNQQGQRPIDSKKYNYKYRKGSVAISQRPVSQLAPPYLLKIREKIGEPHSTLPLIAFDGGKGRRRRREEEEEEIEIHIYECSLPIPSFSSESVIEDSNTVIGWLFGVVRSPLFLIIVFSISFYASRSGATSVSEIAFLIFSAIVNRSPISKVMSGIHSSSNLGKSFLGKTISTSRNTTTTQKDLNRELGLDFNDRYENVAARSAQLKSTLLKAKEKAKYDDMKQMNEFEYSHASENKNDDGVDNDDDNEFDDEAYQREMLKKHVEALRKMWGGRDDENNFGEEEHEDFEGKRNYKRYDDDNDDDEEEEEEGEDVD
jgi:hypothetical protein